MNIPSQSRLDYYWYSSNDSIATITQYGTLLGRSAGTVKIMAVYKTNPSITFVKEFIIYDDNRLDDLVLYNYDAVNYTDNSELYQISLNDTNSFYPQLSLYNWTIVSSNNNYIYNCTKNITK